VARVTVIVCNFNGGEYVLRCLKALERQTFRDFEAVVVDNASSDGSPDRIEREFPSVRMIRERVNLGFAAGNNVGFRHAAASDWAVLLNPDAFAEPDWLEKLVAAATERPDCASIASRLLSANDPATFDGVGDVYHLTGLHWREAHGRPVTDSALSPKEIFSPCAAAALYRVSALHEAGGFDEDYFCYAEDVDLGFRLRLLGYKSWYEPRSVALHVGSATTGVRSDFAAYHGYRNSIWTFVKDMPGPLLWLCLPLHLFGHAAQFARLVMRGQGKVAWRALSDAIAGLPNAWRKRSQVQAARRADLTTIWRVLDKRLFLMRR
jgi:GT2 family glycosyltransferase